MKKFLILSIFALSMLNLSACRKANVSTQSIDAISIDTTVTTTVDSHNNDCLEICESALIKCPSLTENDCLYKCQNATSIEKACLQNFKTCNELTFNCRQPSNIDEKSDTSNNCVVACNNYVFKCISLVPNATEALEIDAYNSCMEECDKWDNEKINCISISPNCEGFTTQCGL